jgi:hypothetical protein
MTRRVEELLARGGVRQLILERFALAERAHVHFHAVRADVFGRLKRAEPLAFENHPITDGDFVTLHLRAGGAEDSAAGT